ncbi:hypothetical protein ACS0TY_008324 [Phlomoides rotata]
MIIAILAPIHKVVESINEKVLGFIPRDEIEYLSSDRVDVPIMLIRNIDQKAGLCNGTKLITT